MISNSINWTRQDPTSLPYNFDYVTIVYHVSLVNKLGNKRIESKIRMNGDDRKKTYVFLSLLDVLISRKETDRVDIQLFTLCITHAISQTQHTAYIYRTRRRCRELISSSNNYVLTLLEFTSHSMYLNM